MHSPLRPAELTVAQNVNWVLTGVCGGLTLGRYAIRWWQSRRFHADDAVHLLAYAILVVHGGTNQVTATAKSQLAIDEKAASHISQDALLAQYKYTNQVGTVNNVFLYLVFWTVKIAFLLFYRLLFKAARTFNRVWWGVLGFTVVTYFIPFAGVLATCAGADTVAAWQLCNSADKARAIKLEYSCAINVATDVIIMALPMWMIKDLKMDIRQKAGLAFIFSIAMFCVALDILRVVEALASNQALYTVLEINMVVIISCLPTYRSLLSMRAKWRERNASRYGSSYGRAGRSGSRAMEKIPSRSQSEHHNDIDVLRDEEAGHELSSVPTRTDALKASTLSTIHITRRESSEETPSPPTTLARPESCTLELAQPAEQVHETYTHMSSEEAAHVRP